MTRLLISTYAGVVLWEDGGWRFLRRRPEGDPDFCFYGITWSTFIVYVAESGIPYGKPGRVGIYDENFKHLSSIEALDDLITPHQIFWWDGTLYVANSGRNRIDTWAWWRHDQQEVAGKIKWLEADGDVDHVNSIWCDGCHFYVVEHRRQLQPKRIRVFTRDWRIERTVEIPGVQGLHNVVIVDGTLVTLAHDCILRIDLGTDQRERIGKFAVNGYLRGLACTADRWYVGMSQMCPRGQRGKGPCQFHVLDRDFGLVETVQLEDTGGVTEIRVVDEPDLCHNGLECPLSL